MMAGGDTGKSGTAKTILLNAARILLLIFLRYCLKLPSLVY